MVSQQVASFLGKARKSSGPKAGARSFSNSSSGWKPHIRDVCGKLRDLKTHPRSREIDQKFYDDWHHQADAELTKDFYAGSHVLIQLGIRELLGFLYNCLKTLLDKGHPEQVAKVLVRKAFVHFKLVFIQFASDRTLGQQGEWSPEEIIKRIVSDGK